jgi:GMP reductase
MRIEQDLKLDYSNVLIRPKRSTLTSRADVKLEREYTFVNSKKIYRGTPIMAANMDGVGTFEMARTLGGLGLFTCLVKNYSANELIAYFNADNNKRYAAALSIGTGAADLEKLDTVYTSIKDQTQLKYICVDVANGYTQMFVETIRGLRAKYPNLVIIAGNVVTADQTQELILNGADIVKVGIGPGSVCTTRIQTGVGFPQLSAVIECADAAHGLGGHIIADGGCSSPGDVAKAFAAGADFVMLGGMLAGHDQGGGDIITKTYLTNEIDDQGLYGDFGSQIKVDKQFVQFYGMSSKAANDKHFGGLKNYRSSEGREVLIPYRGPVAATVQEILGGLRSTCTYVGASTLKQLSKCTTFIRCTDTHNRIFEKQ